jgi:hypothetical protein
MKTIAKILVTISILMISLQVTAGNNQPTLGQVHYKVQIHLPKDIPFQANNVFVVMTDDRDTPIAPPQLLKYGKLSYDFNENKSVIGTRKAMLIYIDGTTSRLFNCTPDVQSGKFIIGGTYQFNVYVVFQNPELSGE